MNMKSIISLLCLLHCKVAAEVCVGMETVTAEKGYSTVETHTHTHTHTHTWSDEEEGLVSLTYSLHLPTPPQTNMESFIAV